MTVKTMDDLFVATLKDIYYAEKQILKALPGMVKKAKGPELKEALETHRQETEGQVERLDKVFKMLDVPARGKKCEAIEGIIGEAKEHMDEIEDGPVLDAGMIGSAQAVEHYEICRYGTLIEWARDLGHDNAIELLQQNLDEEKNADGCSARSPRPPIARPWRHSDVQRQGRAQRQLGTALSLAHSSCSRRSLRVFQRPITPGSAGSWR